MVKSLTPSDSSSESSGARRRLGPAAAFLVTGGMVKVIEVGEDD